MSIQYSKLLRHQGRLFMMGCLCCLSCFLFSCSEDDSVIDEYANWQERNEAMTDQWAASGMKKIRVYTQDDTSTGKNSDYIYVQVLEAGDAVETPLFTDTVRLAYRGRLIPTTKYAEGLVFDETFLGDFSWHTAGMSTMATSGFISGFATAVMNMHKGDYWRVHIPYQLAYGTGGTKNIQGYSNVVFDIALLDHWHPGETRPAFKARLR